MSGARSAGVCRVTSTVSYSAGSLVRYWEQSQASSCRGMHRPATVVPQTGRVVRLLHGGEYKTRSASDAEQFDAADSVPSHTADPGVVGAALSGLSNVVLRPAGASETLGAVASRAPLPAPSVPSLERLDPEAAVGLIVLGASVAARHAFVSPADLAEGAALLAAVDAARLAVAGRKSDASSAREKGWGALVAHYILITRQELQVRADVSVADAGPEFDAAKDEMLLAWMVQGAYVEASFSGQRTLSVRWVLTIKPPALPGLHSRPKASLCVRGNEDRGSALIHSFSPTVSRSTVRPLVILFATMGWVPRTVDVSTAFLQGIPINCPSPVYV